MEENSPMSLDVTTEQAAVEPIISSSQLFSSNEAENNKPNRPTSFLSSNKSTTADCPSKITIPSDGTKNILAESSSFKTPETTSGFDSADSTNDEDFLTTQKAVLSAIVLMDEGLKDEESKGNINVEDECVSGGSTFEAEGKHDTCPERLVSNVNGDTTISVNTKDGLVSSKLTVSEYSVINESPLTKESVPDDGLEGHINKSEEEKTTTESSNTNGKITNNEGFSDHNEVNNEVSMSNEDSRNTLVPGEKSNDMEMGVEQCQPGSSINHEKKLEFEESDDTIMLEESPLSEIQDAKKDIESSLPVSVEISDVEVSVFKYERKKKDKSQKPDEFKLDDMVLSSDEENDIRSPPIQHSAPKPMKHLTQSFLSDIRKKQLPFDVNEKDNINSLENMNTLSSNEDLKNTPDKSETEVVDVVEDINTVPENLEEKQNLKIDSENIHNSIGENTPSPITKDDEILLVDSSSEDPQKKNNSEVAGTTNMTGCETEDSSTLNDTLSNNLNVLKNNSISSENTKNNLTDLEDMLKAALNNSEAFWENLHRETNKPDNKNISESLDPKDSEVICLVDDDEDDASKKKKKPAAAINCVNPNCMSGENLAPPAMFVLSYFGMKRSKGQQVCAECFNIVVEHHQELSCLLKDQKPLMSATFPSHKDVILLDSDEESLSDNESNLSDDTMTMIRENLDDVISDTLTKFDFDFQLRESCDILNNRLSKLEEEATEFTKRYDSVQHSLDEFRKQIYEEFQQETREKDEVHFMECEIPPMPIIKSKLQNQLYNKELMNMLRKFQQERDVREGEENGGSIVATPSRTIATKKVGQATQSQINIENAMQDVTFVRAEIKSEPPPSLPPPGVLPRPKLRVGDLAYTMKVSYFSIWVHCRVIEVIPRNPTENDPSTETYRVKLENVKKNPMRTVTGKYLAYPTPARVQLKVGVRVIAIFKEEDEAAATKDNYYVGVIAEPPKSTNKYRYLVFFDDGYTQYCPHENVLVVCSTSRNVWEDIHPEPRDFIRNYLQQYPERPMVKLSHGQIVKVEWNGRWWIVRVLEVDGSLVKVHFDADNRTEWIYRGSTRLGPMYQELAAAKERQTGSLLRSRGFGGGAHHKSDMPYVEYTRGDGEGDNENKPDEEEKTEEPVEEQAPAPRSVARKSTARKPTEPVISNTTYSKPLITHLPEGRLRKRQLRPKCRPIHFRPHQCSEACVAWTGHTPIAARKYDPLVKPLMFGFERLLGNFKGKTIVLYRAPCGRMIRSSQEMLCYLRGTKSQLTIDLFDFDFWVNPLNEFEEGNNTFGKIEDLSYGKENVRISCVNELDHSMPQYVQYMTAREPANDVNLNLDPEFLVGCDCTDDCEDRTKCSCWQLTLQGKAYVPDGDLDPLFGYQYRRLPERIATGIYECNSRCKCSMTCQNRVAQQPLSCRLQLFKTLKKGWGIRCLHDIPRGAFICIYAGFLLTEQEANEGGKTYGDEYLAELDYIESVENLKEGYESEAKEPSDLEDEDDISQKDTMDIEYEHSADSDGDTEQEYSGRPGDIRLRLRRRTADEAEKDSRKSKTDDDAISISDDELDSDSYYYTVTPFYDQVRKPKTFDANITVNEGEDADFKFPSVRELYGPEENVYIMDAKTHGNIGRYLNHSCSPNVFVQNVFVDTHDLRFPWVAFFANQYIPAGTELTWDYNYDVGSVPGKVMLCYCGSNHCRGRLL